MFFRDAIRTLLKKEGKKNSCQKIIEWINNVHKIISPEQSRRIYDQDGAYRLTLYFSNLTYFKLYTWKKEKKGDQEVNVKNAYLKKKKQDRKIFNESWVNRERKKEHGEKIGK